jgi:membrane protein DedA with SNARE-associated domain
MHPTAFHSVRTFVAAYGYWAVALALLGESAGIPLPGEITLLLASFLAFSEHRLQLGWIIVVAICATTLGGVLGYAVGYYGGRPLLDRYQSFFRISFRALSLGCVFLLGLWPVCSGCAGRYLRCSIFWVRLLGLCSFLASVTSSVSIGAL